MPVPTSNVIKAALLAVSVSLFTTPAFSAELEAAEDAAITAVSEAETTLESITDKSEKVAPVPGASATKKSASKKAPAPVQSTTIMVPMESAEAEEETVAAPVVKKAAPAQTSSPNKAQSPAAVPTASRPNKPQTTVQAATPSQTAIASKASGTVTPQTTANHHHVDCGRAAWYSSALHGHKTASGQPYDEEKMTAAHKHLPFGTKVTVVNRRNGKSCTLTINDRGPYAPNHVIDVSKAAAKELGLITDNKRMVDCYIRIDTKDLVKKQSLKPKLAAQPQGESL